MSKLSKLTTVGAIAIMSTLIVAPIYAERTKGELLKQGHIDINVLSGSMQSAGSPNIHPPEYVTVDYSGSIKFNPGFNTCNAKADPCQATNNGYITPHFDVVIPGHPSRNVKGKVGQKNVIAKAQGLVSTRLYDSPYSDNSGSAKASVKVHEACFEQLVRINFGDYFSTNMQGNWCVGNAKITEAQTAILNTVYNVNSLLNFQGTDIQANNWWPNSSQKRRFITTSYPQFGKVYNVDLPGISYDEGIWQPSIKFEYHNNGTWRIRVFSGDKSWASPFYSVTNDRKTVNFL